MVFISLRGLSTHHSKPRPVIAHCASCPMAGIFSLKRNKLKKRLSATEDVIKDQDLHLLYTAAKRDDAQSFAKLIKRLSKSEKHTINLLKTKVVCPPAIYRKPSIFVLAAQFGNAQVVTFLLRNCAREELVRYAAYSTLEVGVQGQLGSAIRRHFLLQDVTALNAACSAGHDPVVKVLLDAGSDIEATDCCGYTPLANAASNGYVSTAKLLLSRGADVTHSNTQGYTPLHLAAANGHLDVVSLFLDDGMLSPFQFTISTPDRRGIDGRGSEVYAPLPLFLAAIYRQRAVLSLFLAQDDCELHLATVSSKILSLSSYLEPLNRLTQDLSDRGFPPLTALCLKALGDFPLQFNVLPPLQGGVSMISCFATKALEQYQQLTSPYSFESVQHTISVGCYLVYNFDVASVLWMSALNTHAILLSEKFKKNSNDCTIAYEIGRGTHYVSRITALTNMRIKEELHDNGTVVTVPHFPRYIKYGVQMLEMIANFQYHDVHVLGYVQPIQSAVLTLFRLWLCHCDSGHENAPPSQRWSLGEEFIGLSAELISDITTPVHISLEMNRYSRYHPYLHICEDRQDLCTLLDGLCQWGATIFLNQPDSGGRLPIHLAAEADGFRSRSAPAQPDVSRLLLSYGAHSDVYSFMKYRHAELGGVQRLTCLSCKAIVKSKLPYEAIRIPPRLKTLVRVHDEQTALSTRSKQPRAVQDISAFIQVSNSPSYDHYFRLR